jgi:group II intron reverse transcriptase/maturase/CRISPR-associated endonuclease Cas1
MAEIIDPSLPLTDLLPIRSAVVTLECLEAGRPHFFHQAALTAFLRFLLGEVPDYHTKIRIDCPESGRVSYQPGDFYRFSLICLRGGEPLLAVLLRKLQKLPRSAVRIASNLPFRDNWRLSAVQDAFSEKSITDSGELCAYDAETLAREVGLWSDHDRFLWHWLTPARLLKDKNDRVGARGEYRYCRDAVDLPPRLLLERLHDGMADLLRRRGSEPGHRGEPPALACEHAHLFWIDAEYRDAGGNDQVMGGLAGQLHLSGTLSPAWWKLLILGQLVGMGQRVAFGFGRYQLRTPEGGFTYRRPLPAASMLMRAAQPDNLAAAWQNVIAGNDIPPGLLSESEAALAWPASDEEEEDTADGEQAPDPPLDGLHADLAGLSSGDYEAPVLRGYLVPKPAGGVRPLAVPPLRDRVLQRAVHQVLAPAIERLFARGSHGFRPGHSRITASYAIQAAWRAGYRWVYESDVRDFFDSVDIERLRERLAALYGEDPLIDAIAAWMRAPVRFQGELIERRNGLPQGSPLSPLMANLMLDDFDSDMQAAGFHLIRFADDFIVLCKDPGEARRAGEAATASLAEHGLELHPDKTRITAMEEGFRYLGYLFVNDMVLDVSGASNAALDRDKIPPNSWLAQLADRAPIALGREDDLEAVIARIARHETVAIGEREDEGTLLCITGDPCLIATRDKHLRVLRDDKILHHLPWTALQTVILFGNHQITTPAMHAALQHDVPVHLATGMGTYRGVLWGGVPAEQGHRQWLRQVAVCTDPERALEAAREIVGSRLRHMKETLRLRSKSGTDGSLDLAVRNHRRAESLESLRGMEGSATREYYLRLGELLPPEFAFEKRTRRPPRDPFNVLLSIGYTLVYGYTESIVRAVGLLPWQGFYHQGRGRHAALASDLMEPFRHIVERAAMTLVLRGEIRPDAFTETPAGACLIEAAARRKYLALLIGRFETPVKALGDLEPAKLFEHMHRQALSLRDWIEGRGSFKAWRIR